MRRCVCEIRADALGALSARSVTGAVGADRARAAELRLAAFDEVIDEVREADAERNQARHRRNIVHRHSMLITRARPMKNQTRPGNSEVRRRRGLPPSISSIGSAGISMPRSIAAMRSA